MNYQCEKKRANEQKRAQKKITTLENDLRKRIDELATATNGLNKKDENMAELQCQNEDFGCHVFEHQCNFNYG